MSLQRNASNSILRGTSDTQRPQSRASKVSFDTAPALHQASTSSTSKFSIGEKVEALFNGRTWSSAKVNEMLPNGTLKVVWTDGSTQDRIKTADQVRKPKIVKMTGKDDWQTAPWQELKDDSEAFFKQALANLHPKLRHADEIEPDGELQAEMRKLLQPSRHFNALMIGGINQPYRTAAAFEVEGAPDQIAAIRNAKLFPTGLVFTGPQTPAKTLVVTGHKGGGGNATINGIYQLYPGEHHGRSIWRKTLEKRHRSWGELCNPRPQSDPLSRPCWKSATAKNIMPPAYVSGYVELSAPSRTRYLYWHDLHAAWVIGEEPGCYEVFAKCSDVEELCPRYLFRWEVWDVGHRCWYEHPSLKCIKCGDSGS